MDKIIFPSILNNVIVDKDNLKIKHTREGQAEIETIEGRSEFIEESFSHVGELNQETNKYDIEITTSKEYENGYTEKSSSIISIDKSLKSTPSGLCDKIYKHGDNYKLLTQIGEKPFEQSNFPEITEFPYIDEINDTISDGTTLLYPLPRSEITETDIEIDNQITTYGTDTTFEFNGAIPKITLNKVPNDYAYNESRSLAKGEIIDVESFEDIDTTKTIEIKSIEGQTYQNLMQDPIKNSIAKYSIDMQGETIEVTDWKAEQDVEIKEIHGNTFVNMLEDKIDSAIVKNIATYQGKTVSLDENYNRFDKLTIDEIQGNTMQNLIVNPNNVEETCEFIYSGNDTTHTIENSTISKITVDELLGNTWQNSEDLSDIRSVGELQEDGSYKIDILSKNKNLWD